MSKLRKSKRASTVSAYAASAAPIPVLAYVWVGLLVATAVAALCPRFTTFYAVYLVLTLALAAGVLAFLKAVFRDGRSSLHPAFKKFVGYGLAVHYAAAAMPRVDWATAGLIGPGRVAYMFILAVLCLAAGAALFLAMGRPAVFGALGLLTDEEVRDKAARKRRFAEQRKKGFVHGLLEWVDALGFAAILVVLINTFIFQLYQIPSESMVTAFLKNDRPFTSKITAGPRIPLTDWRLPFLHLPQRGDIITMANPRYPENQSVNLKKYLAQLVSMVTFTAVNIDRYLPDGSEKADPLVKRVVGLPGEKLMMIDDVLYSKRATDAAFAPVAADESWKRVDLWKESPELKAKLELVPMDQPHRAVLDTLDAKKRGVDPSALAASIAASARTLLATAPSQARAAAFEGAIEASNASVYKTLMGFVTSLEKPDPAIGDPIRAAGTRADDLSDLALALALSGSSALRASLTDYASCPAAKIAPSDAYVRGGRIVNLMVKDNLLKRAVRKAALIGQGADLASMNKDPEAAALVKDGNDLAFYVNAYDVRNFPEFPAGNEYLGPRQYFAMGDNRYNSLDFRYRTGRYELKPLDPADPGSALYYSNIDPFPLELKYIEGYALFRIWPPSRAGAIK